MADLSKYPGDIDTFTAVADNVDYVEAVHVNQLNEAVHNVETELGINPKGSYSSMKARLEGIEADVSGKAGKVSGATPGNLAALDSGGNLTDSGHSPSEFTQSFLGLSDTPESYTGASGKYARVRQDETGLEFDLASSADEKVKADGADPAAGYLSEKVDGSSIEVNAAAHVLRVKDDGITVDKLAHDLDASGIGFKSADSDKLDGYDASAFAASSHQHSAADVTSGTLSTDRFSAYDDLTAESKIGTGSTQVSAGDHTHAQLHDSATVSDSNTINFGLTGQQITGDVITQMSITADASGLKLDGDEAAPGNNQVYGTDGAGAKGWKDDPSGGSSDGWIDTGDTWSQYSEAFTFPGSGVSVAFTATAPGGRLTVANTTGFDVGQRVKLVSDGGGTTYTNVTQIVTNQYIYVTSHSGHNTSNASISGTRRVLTVADTYGFYVGQLVNVISTAGNQVNIISAISEDTSITVANAHTVFHNDSADFLISPIVTLANSNNTYVAAVITTGDETGKYLPGRKVKFTQGGGTMYGIVLDSRLEPDDEADTVITLFGGEDNAITDGAITDPYYSREASPDGFDRTPSKWALLFTNTTTRSKTSPSANTWYGGTNAWTSGTAINLLTPIGTWWMQFAMPAGLANGSAANLKFNCCLSANLSSSSHQSLTGGITSVTSLETSTRHFGRSLITTTAATLWYWLCRTPTSSIATMYGSLSDFGGVEIRADCPWV